jgi:F-type H+-transporting ATPase subunit b
MCRRTLPTVVAGLLISCGVWLGAACRAQADDHGHPPAPAAAESHSTPADRVAADDHHGVDYNKAPLPGSAPGLGTLFVFSLILFTGFVFAARALVWTPLIAALDQREARINQAHAEAAEAKAQAEQLLAHHTAKMSEVHEQVQGLLARARKDAEQEKSRIIAEAEAAAKNLRDQAIADIQAARQSALSQLEGNLDAQVSRAVKQVIGAV